MRLPGAWASVSPHRFQPNAGNAAIPRVAASARALPCQFQWVGGRRCGRTPCPRVSRKSLSSTNPAAANSQPGEKSCRFVRPMTPPATSSSPTTAAISISPSIPYLPRRLPPPRSGGRGTIGRRADGGGGEPILRLSAPIRSSAPARKPIPPSPGLVRAPRLGSPLREDESCQSAAIHSRAWARSSSAKTFNSALVNSRPSPAI